MARNTGMEGFKELENYLRDMGRLPQKCVTKAANLGARKLLRATRAAAPVDTGELKRGLIIKAEKSRQGKKVYQIVFSSNMNDVFVKYSKDGKRAYYPASQEYGFISRDGGYVPGYGFMRNTADTFGGSVKSTILEVLAKEIDKLR